MKTLKLDQFEKFECNVSQLEEIKGGNGVYTGKGIDATTGGSVKDWCFDNGHIEYWACESTIESESSIIVSFP